MQKVCYKLKKINLNFFIFIIFYVLANTITIFATPLPPTPPNNNIEKFYKASTECGVNNKGEVILLKVKSEDLKLNNPQLQIRVENYDQNKKYKVLVIRKNLGGEQIIAKKEIINNKDSISLAKVNIDKNTDIGNYLVVLQSKSLGIAGWIHKYNNLCSVKPVAVNIGSPEINVCDNFNGCKNNEYCVQIDTNTGAKAPKCIPKEVSQDLNTNSGDICEEVGNSLCAKNTYCQVLSKTNYRCVKKENSISNNNNSNNSGANASTSPDYTIKQIITKLYFAILPIAVVIAIIKLLLALFVLATSQGDPGKLNEFKDTVYSVISGLVVIVGVVTLIKILSQVAGGI